MTVSDCDCGCGCGCGRTSSVSFLRSFVRSFVCSFVRSFVRCSLIVCYSLTFTVTDARSQSVSQSVAHRQSTQLTVAGCGRKGGVSVRLFVRFVDFLSFTVAVTHSLTSASASASASASLCCCCLGTKVCWSVGLLVADFLPSVSDGLSAVPVCCYRRPPCCFGWLFTRVVCAGNQPDSLSRVRRTNPPLTSTALLATR